MIREGIGALLLVSLLATGCVMPNRYGTPRTLAPGTSDHVLNMDVVALNDDLFASTDATSDDSGGGLFFFPWPSYTFRHGLWDGGELGVGFGPLMMLLADLKLRLLESQVVDLAVAPTFGVGLVGLFSTEQDLRTMAQLPLLVGVNLSESVSVVPLAALHGLWWDDGYDTGSQTFGSFGLSVQWRVLPDFALQPGVTALYYPGDPLWIHAGIAFVAGAQPSYTPPPLPDRWAD